MKKKDDNDIILEGNFGGSDISGDEFLDDSVVAEENTTEAIKKLKEKLKKAENEKSEYLTGWQRAKADLINARKRDEEAHRELAKFANEGLIVELIPVLDSFEMAMKNKEAWDKVEKNWRVGVEYIAQQLKKVLEDNGLQELDPLGKSFDINIHEAVEHVPAGNKSDEGKIIEVVQKGYSLNGKVLKVPKVRVADAQK